MKKKYTAPYESPLEEAFAESLKPLLKKSVQLIPQYELETQWGKFRLDFVLKSSDKTIGVECDGETVHGKEAQIYDNWRDIIILNENVVHVIYRLSGPSLLKNITDTAHAFLLCEPKPFKKPAINSIRQKLSGDIFKELTAKINFDDNFETNVFTENSKNIFIKIKKYSKVTADQLHIYKFLLGNKGKRINPLIYKYYKQNPVNNI